MHVDDVAADMLRTVISCFSQKLGRTVTHVVMAISRSATLSQDQVCLPYCGCELRVFVVCLHNVRVCASRVCARCAQAMINICKAAGVVLLRLVRGPMAAVLTYVHSWPSGQAQRGREETVLVFELSGGCLDVGCVEVSEYKARMLCGFSSCSLGEVDLENALCDHLATRFPL